MKVGVLICALMLGVSMTQDAVVQKGAFAEANRLGDPTQVKFFLFSTSYGSYVISQYGLGEVGTRRGHQQFLLKAGVVGDVTRMYFLEHEGDLLLSFEMNETGYVRRMNQANRKMRWLTPIDKSLVNQCVVEENAVQCGAGDKLTKIDLVKGAILSSN